MNEGDNIDGIEDSATPHALKMSEEPPDDRPSRFIAFQHSLDRVDKSIGDLTKSIQDLSTNAVKSLARPRRSFSSSASRSVSSVSHSDESEFEVEPPLRNPSRTIAEVRKCDWKSFKNRYTDEDGVYAIEVLEGDSTIYFSQQEEIAKRKATGVYKPEPPRKNVSQDAPAESLHPPPPPDDFLPRPPPPPEFLLPPPPPKEDFQENAWIQRVRINSRAVMELLGSCNRNGFWESSPRTFMHPFRYLLSYHDKMRRKVDEIMANVGEEFRKQNYGADHSVGSNNSAGQDEEDRIKNSYDFSDEAREELRCYIKFVDEQLVPPSRRFDIQEGPKPQTIRFHELEYLFKPGQYIYFEYTNNVGKPLATEQRIKRLYAVNDTAPCLCVTSECEHGRPSWKVRYYYLDHDGERYGAHASTLHVWPWLGERNIATLDFLPLEYLPENRKAEIQRARSDGMNFVNHLAKRYSFYSGWSLTKGPELETIDDPKTSSPMKNPEHVESDVLVDLTETFDSIPSWKPVLHYIGPWPPERSNMDKRDNLPIIEWSDRGRTTVMSSSKDVIYDDSWLQSKQARKFVNSMPALCLEDFNTAMSRLIPDPEGDELALLPRRMFAYAVWDRKFLPELTVP